jgi:hypothetical protein
MGHPATPVCPRIPRAALGWGCLGIVDLDSGRCARQLWNEFGVGARLDVTGWGCGFDGVKPVMLRYMHRNPVKRGLVDASEQRRWSSYRFYPLDEAGPVRVNRGWGKISFRDRAA